jgi:glycosyltransferase involved in cell wall biosynthesis
VTEPIVDICIPVHNAWDYVQRCLAGIIFNTVVPKRWIIHDDASERDTSEQLMIFAETLEKNITLARSDKQCWFTTSVNRCLSLTKAEWVIVLNSDIEIQDTYWFEKLQSLHQSLGEKAGLIGCPDSGYHEGHYDVDGKVQGHLWFFKRQHLEVVGLLDESNPDLIHIRSDDEWSARWRARGFRTTLACDIRHVHGGDSHPGGGASWGRRLHEMPTRLEHVVEARATPMRILVDK